MNEQISIMDIMNMVIKRWWVVIIVTLVVGSMSFVISNYFMEPKYTSSGKLIANNTNEKNESVVNINTLNTNTRLVSTYIQIFQTNSFLKKIATDSGLDYSASDIRGMLTLTALNNTEVLEIKVVNKSKVDAKIIAELILDNAQLEIERIGSGGSVSIIDEASTPDKPISPNVQLNTIIGILLGALLGVLIVFIIELFDTRIKSEDDLVAKFDMPILGVIPDLGITSK